MKIRKTYYLPALLVVTVLVIILVLAYTNDSCIYLRKGKDHLYLNDGTHELFWFEGIHSNDPDNIMFGDIKVEFTKFDPNLVLVEGGRNENIQPTAENAIVLGESSYVAFLAHENGIPCLSTEPSDSYMGQELLRTYEMDDIIATLTFLQIKQWQRESAERTIDFSDMIVGWIRANQERMFGTIDDDINFAYIQNIIEPYTGFRVDDSNWLDAPADSILDGNTIVHTIWQDRTSLRNKYLIELIQERRPVYDRIFIMMGFDHAHAVMAELEKLYQLDER